MATWTSKLGTKYDLADIRRRDKDHHKHLTHLRRRPENQTCADCGAPGTVWAIVNHGAFVCLRCASVHRSLGTHISVPKGCTGTYHWGADELERMAAGNVAANRALGSPPTVAADCSDAVLRAFLVDKYDRKRWRTDSAPAEPPDLISFDEAPVAAVQDDFFASFGL